MITIEAELVEKEIIAVVTEICEALQIDGIIDRECCPGTFIKSQVLLDSICNIEDALGIVIPVEYYVFSEKNNRQLSIKETAEKILKVAKNGK